MQQISPRFGTLHLHRWFFLYNNLTDYRRDSKNWNIFPVGSSSLSQAPSTGTMTTAVEINIIVIIKVVHSGHYSRQMEHKALLCRCRHDLYALHRSCDCALSFCHRDAAACILSRWRSFATAVVVFLLELFVLVNHAEFMGIFNTSPKGCPTCIHNSSQNRT